MDVIFVRLVLIFLLLIECFPETGIDLIWCGFFVCVCMCMCVCMCICMCMCVCMCVYCVYVFEYECVIYLCHNESCFVFLVVFIDDEML